MELRDSSTSFSTLNKGHLLTLIDREGQVLHGAQGLQNQLLHLFTLFDAGGQVLREAQGLQQQLLHLRGIC